jgi:SAM-dependent methyltransferase
MTGETKYGGFENLEVMADAINYNDFLVGLIRQAIRPQDRVLDFGAGTGQFAFAVRAAGHQVHCLEPDLGLAARLREGGFAVLQSLESAPDGAFDYIYAINVLEHIEDDRDTLANLRKKLVSGGRLLIYAPAFPALYTAMDRRVGHHRRYTKATLRSALEGAGFAITHIRYADSIGYLATLAYKYLGRSDGGINPYGLRVYDRLVFPVSVMFDRGLAGLLGKNVYAFALSH